MNVIAIYHHPQECGSAYVAFISQETGEMVEAVDIPDGYWDSGLKRIDVYMPVYAFTEKVNMSPIPTVDNVTLKAKFMPNPKKYVFRVTKVDNITKDETVLPSGSVFTTWKADVEAEACTHDIKWQYSTHRDHFRKQLSKAGFDMGHWTLTKRMKTPFKVFLTDICSKYKDYHLINLLEIG